MGMSQKLPLGGFKWDEETSQFNEAFMKSYTDHIDEGCLFEVDLSISCKFIYLHNDLPFLPERMKTGKIEKRVVNMHDKKQYVKQGWIVLIMHSHIFFC